MTCITDKKTFARALGEGVELVERQGKYPSRQVAEEEIDERGRSFSAMQLGKYRYQSQLPTTIDDQILRRFIWAIVVLGKADLVWVLKIVRATTTWVPEPVSIDWLYSYLDHAWPKEYAPGEEEFQAIIHILLPPAPAPLPSTLSNVVLASVVPGRSTLGWPDARGHLITIPAQGVPIISLRALVRLRRLIRIVVRYLRLFIMLLCLLGIVALWPLSTTETTVQHLDAKAFWQPIANLRRGDVITVTCISGFWTVDTTQAGQPWVGPEGYAQQEEWAALPTANLGSMIGRLGAVGEKFALSCNATLTASSDGALYASINDSSKREDNNGFVDLKVTLQRSLGLGMYLMERTESWLYGNST